MDSSPSFGAWLRRRRKALDITQTELAHRAGCVVGTIRSIEADARRPSRQLGARLADELQLDTDARTAFINAARGVLSADQLPMPRRTAASVEPSTPVGVPWHSFNHARVQLPTQPTALIGRETECAELDALLASHSCRLITIVGPGGIGKTRLALAAAERAVGFDERAVFVSLAAISNPALIAPTILTALGVPLHGERDPQAQLLEVLRPKAILLVLDNLEQLLVPDAVPGDTATAMLSELLAHAPRIMLLATSRERLGISGEWLYDLAGLNTPAEATIRSVESSSAGQLFVQRARQVRRQFVLTNSETHAVVRICQLVEGMPLAIELAAAALRSRSCAGIAEAINRDIAALATGLRVVPERHRSIVAAFEHSWHLLSQEERSVFARLSVFRGGFEEDAAAQVAQTSPELLAALVDKSLLRWDGVARYDMHELVRQYAGEKLEQIGESDHTRHQHLAYFLRLAEQAEQELLGPRQVVWQRRLGNELDNLRAALAWSLEQGIPSGPALAISFWDSPIMPVRERITWLSRLLDHPTALASTSARAKALLLLSILKWWSRPEARSLAEEALALYRELGDQGGIASALHGLARAVLEDDKEAGRQLMLESLALYRALGDTFEIAHVLGWLGNMVEQHQDYARAHAYLEESLALYRELGHVGGVRDQLCNLGELELNHGNYAAARTWLTESLELQRSLGLPDEGEVHSILGQIALRQGDYEQAQAYVAESVSLYRDMHPGMVGPCGPLASLGYIALRQGNKAHAHTQFVEALECFSQVESVSGVAYTLEGLASLAVAQGQYERAVRLFTWADSVRRAIGDPRPPVEQADVDRDFTVIRSQLDEATIETARAKGRELTLEQAIAYALERSEIDPVASTGTAAST
jgi:predicted ATPase/transcriptional regulator with XRE-family HTH domain/Tfp pilus assembly protein PilF